MILGNKSYTNSEFFDELCEYESRGLLYSQTHPTFPLHIWNYTPKVQYEGLWDDITLMCRGLVTDSNGIIMARPFPKFFNIEEEKHASTADFEVFEKLDGCCHGDTVISTETGPMTIREICENKYSGRVYSFNHDQNTVELQPIMNWSILDSSDDWYELETTDGDILFLTGNHRVWIDDLKCYRRVDEIDISDENILLKIR